ncbi:glycosyltransferase family 2 protein [Mariniflexile ostreae]|uniref:Glycosyltransferase family 2 protein n=1 Tax=Mariniflexile ostreae TaxID=1520892 RepID=A0ABV5FCX8_9FLAO
MHKNVFIIIVSYNGEPWLRKNLESIRVSHYPVKVLMVDNASSDRSIAIVKSFPEVVLIESKTNLGFGKANNIGIQEALKQGADYVFLLNQDTWIFPNTIEELLSAVTYSRDFGIVSPLHFSSDATILDESFNTYWKRKTISISENLDQVPFVNAAAWFMPRSVVEKVGYFEPLFQHYGEDRNYINRVIYHQYKIIIAKNAKICHDRTIVRNFKKDCIQGRFQILNAILNINDTLILGYWKGFVSVFGLPKYFFKSYPFSKNVSLYFNLLGYFFKQKFNVFLILKKRAYYK